MKRLVINADDFGADRGRTSGIMEAIEQGVVTSVSLLADGNDFKEAVASLRGTHGSGISVGIHLNLSEGRPIAKGLRLLVNNDGMFRGKSKALSLFQKSPAKALAEEIDREIEAQVERVLEAGLEVTHLDGHQHVHLFPAVLHGALRAAKRYGVTWVRLPLEDPPLFVGQGDPLAEEAMFFLNQAFGARRFIAESGIRTTDHFRGLFLKGRIDQNSLLATVEGLPSGHTELMVHPGRASHPMSQDAFGTFGTKDRERELEALLSESFRRRLEVLNIQLVSFKEATTGGLE